MHTHAEFWFSCFVFFSGQSSGAKENRLLPFVSVEDITNKKKPEKKNINCGWFFIQMITNGAILVGVNVHCLNAGTWMLFYFNINVCRDLPFVIYHKQYVTVYLKLHNLRLALGMNIKTVRLCIKTGFRLERFQSKQDLLYSWNTSVPSCVWIQKNFQGIKKGGGVQCNFW